MIARVWQGVVATADSDAYAQYMQDIGMTGYAETPGNRGGWMLRRTTRNTTEFVMFTLWDLLDALKSFEGRDWAPPARAPASSHRDSQDEPTLEALPVRVLAFGFPQPLGES